LGLAILCVTITEGAGLDWLALSMVDDYLTDPVRASIAFAVMMAAMTIVRFSGGLLIDRFGRVVVLRVFAVAGILGLLMIILSHDYLLALVGAALWGAGVALGFPVLLSAAADGDADGSSSRVSIVASFGYVAFLVGPPALGFLGQTWGLLNMFYVLVALLAIFVVVAGAAKQRESIT
jgi:MFS family permease